MKSIKSYLLAGLIAFNGVPYIMKNTGGLMLMLMIILPLFVFISSMIYGYNNKDFWYSALLIPLTFITSVLIFYGADILIYLLIYLVLSFVGGFIGKRYEKNVG